MPYNNWDTYEWWDPHPIADTNIRNVQYILSDINTHTTHIQQHVNSLCDHLGPIV